MSHVRLAETTKEHVDWIIPRLRDSEGAEVLQQMVDRAVLAQTGFINEQIVCIYGFNQVAITEPVYTWLVGTEEIAKHPRPFLTIGRAVVENAKARFGPLAGMVRADYSKSIKWLKRLEFEISDEIADYGPYPVVKFQSRVD